MRRLAFVVGKGAGLAALVVLYAGGSGLLELIRGPAGIDEDARCLMAFVDVGGAAERVVPRVHRRRPGMVGAALKDALPARLPRDRRHDAERRVETGKDRLRFALASGRTQAAYSATSRAEDGNSTVQLTPSHRTIVWAEPAATQLDADQNC